MKADIKEKIEQIDDEDDAKQVAEFIETYCTGLMYTSFYVGYTRRTVKDYGEVAEFADVLYDVDDRDDGEKIDISKAKGLLKHCAKHMDDRLTQEDIAGMIEDQENWLEAMSKHMDEI